MHSALPRACTDTLIPTKQHEGVVFSRFFVILVDLGSEFGKRRILFAVLSLGITYRRGASNGENKAGAINFPCCGRPCGMSYVAVETIATVACRDAANIPNATSSLTET